MKAKEVMTRKILAALYVAKLFCMLIYLRIELILTCVCGSNRGLLRPAKTFNCFVVLLCAFFCLAAHGLCSTNGMQNPPKYDDACASSRKNYNLGFSDTIVGGTSLGCASPPIHNSFENVCPDTHSFCFPSTLSGFNHKEKSLKAVSFGDSGISNRSLSSDYGIFKLLNGGVASCSLNSRGVNDVPSLQTEGYCKNDIPFFGGSLLKQMTTQSWSKDSEMSKSSSFDGSFTPNVRIDPTVLDWGQKYLYSTSVAFLTVVNTCNDSILHLYEPFSNELQFYPCNFTEVSLGPGESALICFVFFPRRLGSSSAHLILQTSSGGFIVEAKGYASESPFGIKPLLGLEISPGGRLSKNFSLLNPFDETVYVVEITTWISASSGHNSVETKAICGVNNSQDFDNLLFSTIKDHLVVKSSQIGSPIIAIKPHRNWEIGPNSSETLLEIDITVGFEGKIFGACCLHLLRSSQDKSETIMVPIEAETNSHFGYEIVGIFVSATLEGLAACDGGETVITISLRNHAPCALSFVKVIEVADSEFFHIKYMEGLLLFPNTVTQVGIIFCGNLHLHGMSPKVSNLQENCKLVILTNDTTSPQVEIPCEDALYICFEHQRLSSVGIKDKSKLVKSGNMRAGYAVRSMRLPPNVRVTETADVDEFVLGNWVSQGATNDMAVLQDREVLFPMVQVGSYVSRWITVKNPSHHPVMMQLILNSGEIVDECRGPDDLLHFFSSGNLVLDDAISPTKYGFSLPESAVTEAYVHPYDHATLGPIIFYPSKRCGWNGSALIRNNLSGVEWIPLRGFGGLLSLVLLERSEHVESVNFDLKLHKLHNFSLPYALLHMKEMTSACSRPLVKELYAKNTGDLPLEVKTMRVSGRECGLDGFKIHDCRGFALEPGESIKFLISYQTDFSVSMVHRDLELALATGIFLIPMKASVRYDVLSNCKKSMFWTRVKKWFLGFLLVASLIFLVFCFIFPQTITFGSLDYLCKNNDNSIPTTLKRAGKTPLLPCNQRKGKLSMPGEMNNLFCSVGKGTTSTMRATCIRYSYDHSEPSDQEISQHLMKASENHKKISHLLDTQNEGKLSSTSVQSSDVVKASQLGKLVIKIGKEKGRRRKKKSPGANLTALSEASSSQNGNSTPPSPLSPVARASTKCSWPLSPDVEQPPLQVAAQHSEKCQASAPTTAKTKFVLEPGVPVECCNNNVSSPQVSHSAPTSDASIPVKIPSSATCLMPSGPSSSSLVSTTSTVTLSARAPGSKLDKQKAVLAPKAGLADEYTYDIWGGHLSGLHLLVPKDVTCMKSSPAQKNFDSFFVGGPQAIK